MPRGASVEPEEEQHQNNFPNDNIQGGGDEEPKHYLTNQAGEMHEGKKDHFEQRDQKEARKEPILFDASAIKMLRKDDHGQAKDRQLSIHDT